MDTFIEILEDELEALLYGSGMQVVVFEDDEGYSIKFICPDEFIITYRLGKDDMVLKSSMDAVPLILRFKDMYAEGAFNSKIGQAFLDVPGVFSFATDVVDERSRRILGSILYERYGSHNIYSMTFHEDNIRVDTRGGRYYFKFSDFNVSLKKELELMDKMMRKPLRKRKL